MCNIKHEILLSIIHSTASHKRFGAYYNNQKCINAPNSTQNKHTGNTHCREWYFLTRCILFDCHGNKKKENIFSENNVKCVILIFLIFFTLSFHIIKTVHGSHGRVRNLN